MITAEVCCAEIWKCFHKNNRWIVKNTNLEVMGKLLAAIRSDSCIEHQENDDDNYEFIVDYNGPMRSATMRTRSLEARVRGLNF